MKFLFTTVWGGKSVQTPLFAYAMTLIMPRMPIHYSLNDVSKHGAYLDFRNWFLMLIYGCSLLPRSEFYHFLTAQYYFLMLHKFITEFGFTTASWMRINQGMPIKWGGSLLGVVLLFALTRDFPEISKTKTTIWFLFIYENVPYFTKFKIL